MLNTILGAIAGGMADKSGGTSSSVNTVDLKNISDLNKGRSGIEALGDTTSMDQFNQLLELVKAGPGASSITDALGATNNYATQLQQMLSQGGAPGAQQIGQAGQYAQSIFAPQQTALNQQFDDQRVQAQRMAAKLGRPGNDPILQNKLMQEQTRQQTMLNSQQGSFQSQYADQLMGRQLDLGNSLMNVRNGLATQAFNNRQTLLGLGQQLVSSERNYRMGTATRTGNNTQDNWSGGGTKGAIIGGLAGLGADQAMAGKFMSMGMGMPSGGGAPATGAGQVKSFSDGPMKAYGGM